MKKFLYIILLFLISLSVTCSANMDFSLSGNGSAMLGNMSRDGDYIYMQYNMSGLNSPDIMGKIPAEQQSALAGISGAEVDMVLQCSSKSVKVRSFKMTDANGYTMESALNSDWMPLTNDEDIAKLNDLCGKL